MKRILQLQGRLLLFSMIFLVTIILIFFISHRLDQPSAATNIHYYQSRNIDTTFKLLFNGILGQFFNLSKFGVASIIIFLGLPFLYEKFQTFSREQRFILTIYALSTILIATTRGALNYRYQMTLVFFQIFASVFILFKSQFYQKYKERCLVGIFCVVLANIGLIALNTKIFTNHTRVINAITKDAINLSSYPRIFFEPNNPIQDYEVLTLSFKDGSVFNDFFIRTGKKNSHLSITSLAGCNKVFQAVKSSNINYILSYENKNISKYPERCMLLLKRKRIHFKRIHAKSGLVLYRLFIKRPKNN